jgi:protein-disulfide isomerase
MNELYSSDAYIKYATEQTQAYIDGFMAQYGDTNEDTNVNDEDTTTDEEETNNASTEDVKTIVEDMVSNSPIRGDKDARFTIVEYTELHCPYCQRHAQAGTINSVIEKFP